MKHIVPELVGSEQGTVEKQALERRRDSIVMPFSFISLGALCHALSPVFPLSKFFLIVSSFPQPVNMLMLFGKINRAVIALKWIGDRRNQAREFN